MFRKLLIAAVLSLSFFAPLALPAQSEAHEVAVNHRRTYEVFYRTCGHDAWRCAGTYRFRDDAVREVHILHHRGFEAVIR